MDEDEITQRLRDAGDQPVPGEVRTSHLSQMHAATPVAEKQKRFGRLAVAAAAFVGFAVGSTGFAMAGALPDPAQQVAHDVLAVVQVDVENPRNRGQCISAAARANPDDEHAKAEAKAACPKGKPDHAGPPDGVGKGRPDHAGVPGGPNGIPHADDPCKGPPPWAGKGGKATPEEKQAFTEQRAACPPDDEDQPEEAEEVEELEIEEPEPEPEPQDQGLPEPAPPAEQGNAPQQTPPAPPADAAPEQPAEEVQPEEIPAETDPDTDAPAG